MLLPIQTTYISGKISVFEKLVSTAEENSLTELPPQLHDFLVSCLVERLEDADIVHQTLALGFLGVQEKFGSEANVQLRRVGDGALILDGLFPERSNRLNVHSTYFRCVGQAAYANLGMRLIATGKTEPGKYFGTIAGHFALLAKVLRASRGRPEITWGMRISGGTFQ